MSGKMKVIRHLLKLKKESDLKKFNKTNFKSIYDVLEISNQHRDTPQVIKNIALKEVIVSKTNISDVTCLKIEPNFKNKYFKNTPQNLDILLFYIHGGGFVGGFAEQGSYFIKAIERRIGCKAVAIEYDLSPEVIFPHALNQIFNVYKEVIKTHNPKKIIIAGESAGGNLTLSLLLKIKEENLPMPKLAIVASGFLDLTNSGTSYFTNEKSDVSLSKNQLEYMAHAYVFGNNKNNENNALKNPYVSPIFGNFENLPPIFFSVCEDEILFSDTLIAHQKCVANKVKTKLVTNKNCFHGYMIMGDFFEESKIVCNNAAKFIKTVMKLKTINIISPRKKRNSLTQKKDAI